MTVVDKQREDAERTFNVSACDRLIRSNREYQDEHGYYLPTLAWLLNETRRERDALVAQVAAFHRHVETMIEPQLFAHAQSVEDDNTRLVARVDELEGLLSLWPASGPMTTEVRKALDEIFARDAAATQTKER